MKPVSGAITSSKPISLSKAARALSKFISIENGASQAVSAYLRRASAAFNELVQFQGNLKSGKLDRSRKHKKSRSQTAEEINKIRKDERENPRFEQPPPAVSRGEDGSRDLDEERRDFDYGRRKTEKNKKKRRQILDERGGGGGAGGGAEEGEANKMKKKKIEIEEGLDDSNDKANNRKKKKKKKRRRRIEGGEEEE